MDDRALSFYLIANHFLTGEKEREGFFVRSFMLFWGDDQNVLKKGD
jgi:hypothetical protein